MYACFFVSATACTYVRICCTPQLRSHRPARAASLTVSIHLPSVYWPVTRSHVTAVVFQTLVRFCDTFTSDFGEWRSTALWVLERRRARSWCSARCEGSFGDSWWKWEWVTEWYDRQGASPLSRSTVFYTSGPLFVSSCKISAKLDNRWPSNGDSNNSRWPPLAILDYEGKRIWTIPHVAGPHYLRTHQTCWRYFDRRRRYASKRIRKNAPWRWSSTSGSNFDAPVLLGRSYVSSGKISAKSDYRLQSYIDFTILPFGATFSLPSVGGLAPPSKTTFHGPSGVFIPQTASWSVQPFLHSEAEMSHVTDRQTPRTSVRIDCISCIRCSLKICTYYFVIHYSVLAYCTFCVDGCNSTLCCLSALSMVLLALLKSVILCFVGKQNQLTFYESIVRYLRANVLHTWSHANVQRFTYQSEQRRTKVDRFVHSDRHIHANQFLESKFSC